MGLTDDGTTSGKSSITHIQKWKFTPDKGNKSSEDKSTDKSTDESSKTKK